MVGREGWHQWHLIYPGREGCLLFVAPLNIPYLQRDYSSTLVVVHTENEIQPELGGKLWRGGGGGAALENGNSTSALSLIHTILWLKRLLYVYYVCGVFELVMQHRSAAYRYDSCGKEENILRTCSELCANTNISIYESLIAACISSACVFNSKRDSISPLSAKNTSKRSPTWSKLFSSESRASCRVLPRLE